MLPTQKHFHSAIHNFTPSKASNSTPSSPPSTPFPTSLQMSLLPIESPKHCAKQGLNVDKLSKKLLYIISTVVFSCLSLALLLWLLLRPSRPHFVLKQTHLYQLNSSIEVTLVSTNPNKRVGIYYDQIRAYASYREQQITVDSPLPPFYQGHRGSDLLTAYLSGNWLPVAPFFGAEVGRDQLAGELSLSLRLIGRLRWKVGSWVSGTHRFSVECLAVMAVDGDVVSVSPSSSREGTQCFTDV